jgi:hypothetical protein
MLRFLAGRAGERKVRLFACACVRAIWHLLNQERSRRAVEVAERYADGAAHQSALAEAWSQAREVLATFNYPSTSPGKKGWAAVAARDVSRENARSAAKNASQCTAWAVGGNSATPETEREWWQQASLLRCIFGPLPFRPVTPLPSMLAWEGGTVRQMAEAIYQERRLPAGTLDPARLAVLADALEEAGAEGEMIEHCRSAGPHVRGCWPVDLLLGQSWQLDPPCWSPLSGPGGIG